MNCGENKIQLKTIKEKRKKSHKRWLATLTHRIQDVTSGIGFKAKAKHHDRKNKAGKLPTDAMIGKGSNTNDGTFLSPISANNCYMVAACRLITSQY